MELAQELRRTRFVCISDTHNCTVKLPPGDVLIHAGDLTNQGSFSEVGLWLFQYQQPSTADTQLMVAIKSSEVVGRGRL